MPDLITHPTSTAEWHALVNEAECAAHCRLIQEMESYLVFLLMRFCREPGLASRVFALEYLDSTLAQGRAAYRQLSMLLAINSAASSPGTNAGLYARLSENFVALMDVLLVLRNPGGQAPQLGVLEAYDLWNDTGSRTALKAYQAATQRGPQLFLQYLTKLFPATALFCTIKVHNSFFVLQYGAWYSSPFLKTKVK